MVTNGTNGPTPETPKTTVRHDGAKRFETLNTIGQLVSGLGWAIVILGLFVGLVLLSRIGVAGLGVIAGAALYGVVIVGYGQALQCLVAITRSTERTTRLLESRSGHAETGR